MAEPIGALHAHMSAGHAEFRQGMVKAREAVRTNAAQMRRAMDGVGKSFGGVIGNLSLFRRLTLAAGVTAFAALVKSAINTADQIGKTAQALGVTTESLSTMAFAAKLAGVELPTLSRGMRHLNEQAVAAAEGTGQARHAFAAMGIELRTQEGSIKTSDTLLRELADQFAGMADGAEKTSLAAQLFGSRIGTELIPLLNQGAAGIAQVEERARQLGLELSTDTTRMAERFNDQLTVLRSQATGLGIAIGTALLPRLFAMTEAMTEAQEAGKGLWSVLGAGLKATGPTDLEVAERALGDLIAMQEQIRGLWGERLGKAMWEGMDMPAALEEAQQRYSEALIKARDAELDRIDTAQALKKAEEDTARAQEESAQRLMENIRARQEQEAAEQRALQLAEQRQRQGEQAIEGLRREIDLFDATTRAERMRWEISQGRFAELEPAQQQALQRLAEELDALDALAQAEAERDAQRTAALQRIAVLERQALTPTQAYKQTVEEINALWDTGELSVTAYSAAIQAARQELDRFGETGVQQITLVQQATELMARRASDAIADFATGSKVRMADFVRAAIRDLVRLYTYQLLVGGARPLSLFSASASQPEPRALGGPVAARRMYEVNERGPELLSTGNRHFLMMANQPGQVTPLDDTSSSPVSAPQSIRVVNVLDPALVNDWAASPAGEKVIVNAIRRHATQVREWMR